VSCPGHWHRQDFETILERLYEAAGEDGEPDPVLPAPHSQQLFRSRLESVAEVLPDGGYVAPCLLNRMYGRDASGAAGLSGAVSEIERVAAELGITSDLGIEDLHRLRRRFARLCHPDRVPPPQRRQATLRMSIANMLIDEALRARLSRG
jgi:hypothetical protein